MPEKFPVLPEAIEAELAAVAFGRLSEVAVVAGREVELTLVAKLPGLGDGVRVVLVGVDGVRLPVVEAGLTELADELLGAGLVVLACAIRAKASKDYI